MCAVALVVATSNSTCDVVTCGYAADVEVCIADRIARSTDVDLCLTGNVAHKRTSIDADDTARLDIDGRTSRIVSDIIVVVEEVTAIELLVADTTVATHAATVDVADEAIALNGDICRTIDLSVETATEDIGEGEVWDSRLLTDQREVSGSIWIWICMALEHFLADIVNVDEYVGVAHHVSISTEATTTEGEAAIPSLASIPVV